MWDFLFFPFLSNDPFWHLLYRSRVESWRYGGEMISSSLRVSAYVPFQFGILIRTAMIYVMIPACILIHVQ